ncbi:NCS2 family permease [Lentisphaerota bacterium WC36G]|nr:NCS2 family permease [Lentisphaerae bacterium WC36]
MIDLISRFFKFEERKTNISTEALAGFTIFTAMSYIIFLQPSIMTGKEVGIDTGMDMAALITGTCIASAVGCFLMGILANYPIGLAPGMGGNFLLVITVIPAVAVILGKEVGSAAVWQVALGLVFVSGLLFIILTFFNVRQLFMHAISPSLKAAISAGIGIFITIVGLKNGHIIEVAQNTGFVLTADLRQSSVIIFFIGLIAITSFCVLKIKGGVLYGIIIAAIVSLLVGEIKYNGIVDMPASMAPVFAKLDITTVLKNIVAFIPLIIVLTFLDIFDTMGTLIGVGTHAGLMKNGKLDHASQAFASDSVATLFGSVCGHSTVTCYIESATGVEVGGRTGFAAIITGIFFLLALFFQPVVLAVSEFKPITAPALVVVGAMMMKSAREIDWDDYSESVPAFLILVGVPLTYSIAYGMMLGFVAYPIVKLLTGKGKKIGYLNYIMGAILLVYLLWIKPKGG